LQGLERAESCLDAETVGAILTDLRTAREGIGGLPLENPPLDALLPAARESYAEARKAMKPALESRKPAECHAWRKAVQHHCQQMRLLEQAWPEEESGRIALARDLAQVLGEHHDLAVLSETIAANAALFGQQRDVERLASLIEARQGALLSEAAPLGAQLFAEKPKAFFKRIGEIAARGGDCPSPV
jgi:hypothetical protein